MNSIRRLINNNYCLHNEAKQIATVPTIESIKKNIMN